MPDPITEDFSFGNKEPGRSRNSRSGDRLKHPAWIIPLLVFLLIVGLCVDYALQSRDREGFTTETYMRELEGRVLRAMTWSSYVPASAPEPERAPGDPFLQLLAPEIEAEPRAMDRPGTKPGKDEKKPRGDGWRQHVRRGQRVPADRRRAPLLSTAQTPATQGRAAGR